MKIMQRLFISATLMISSLSCWANGGPVAWSMGMPLGGLVPKQENSIELLREDLNITIVDLDHYTVEANYTLTLRCSTLLGQGVCSGTSGGRDWYRCGGQGVSL